MCHATSKVEDAAAEMLYERLGEAGGRGRQEGEEGEADERGSRAADEVTA